MIHFVGKHLYVFYTILFSLHLINMFFNLTYLNYLVGLLAIPILLISFIGATKLFRILGVAFIVTGTALFIYSGVPLHTFPLHMTTTLPLLAFLSVLPWMNSVVRAGRYDRRINALMKANVSDLGKLYVRSSLTTYLLITFINLSALPLTQEVLLKNLSNYKKRLRDSFISKLTLRAFALTLAWSPMEIIVAMTVDTTGVGYLTYLPWLFTCSILVLMIDWFVGNKRYQSVFYQTANTEAKRQFTMKQIIVQIVKLFVALIMFLTLVIVVGKVFNLDFILSVTLVIIPFSFGWALLMRRTKSLFAIGWKTWKVRTNNMQNFVTLFLSLSLFSSSLNETPLLQIIQTPFVEASEFPIVILFLIQITYLLMSMVGVHPIATIGVLIEVLKPLYAVINPLSIGMVLIIGALSTATVGTYGITVTMTAMNTRQNPYRITARNMPFALLFGTMGTFIAFLLL